jgi:hypothetical protein
VNVHVGAGYRGAAFLHRPAAIDAIAAATDAA